MSGPERHAVTIARRIPYIHARKLAKLAGIRVEAARRILAAEAARRNGA